MKIDIEDKIMHELLRSIQAACADVSCECLVIGAYARDIVCKYVHGLRPRRLTTDLDLAVLVKSWAQFQMLADVLEHKYEFKKGKFRHEFCKSGLSVDIVPFGGVEDECSHIQFPETKREMNMTGFQEAMAQALNFDLGDGVCIRVPDLETLLLLKFISWNDQPMDRAKDAQDAIYILESYWSIQSVQDEIYAGSGRDLLEVSPFEPDLAASSFLMRKIKQSFSPLVVDQLRNILEKQTKRGMFIPQMEAIANNPRFVERILDACVAELKRF